MFFHSSRYSVLKIFVIVAAVLTLTACASGANGGAGSGSISAYGTIDEGVSIKSK